VGLATQFFSDEQMEGLRRYPDIGREELVRFFTLTGRDQAFIDNQGRLRQGGADPAQVQALLGHSSLDTSARYWGLSSNRTVIVDPGDPAGSDCCQAVAGTRA
jgi:integrase